MKNTKFLKDKTQLSDTQVFGNAYMFDEMPDHSKAQILVDTRIFKNA